MNINQCYLLFWEWRGDGGSTWRQWGPRKPACCKQTSMSFCTQVCTLHTIFTPCLNALPLCSFCLTFMPYLCILPSCSAFEYSFCTLPSCLVFAPFCLAFAPYLCAQSSHPTFMPSLCFYLAPLSDLVPLPGAIIWWQCWHCWHPVGPLVINNWSFDHLSVFTIFPSTRSSFAKEANHSKS